MPSASPLTSPLAAGYTALPGLQVSPYGAILANLKVYDFTLTDTGAISSTGSTGAIAGLPNGERAYTISGMTTGDIPFALIPSTGPFGFAGASPGPMLPSFRLNTTSTGINQLAVNWVRPSGGTSTSGGMVTAGTATGPITSSTGQICTLFTIAYFNQASSTTT